MAESKVICVLPVKNEDWILEKTLSVLSLFCERIIVGDAGSWDKTREIIAAFPKAVLVDNTNPHMGNINRRQIILDKAREFGPNNIIFCFNADEIPSSNILTDRSFWLQVRALAPGTSMLLEWITLWKSPRQYRDDDSVWSRQYKPFVFRDDGKTRYAPGDTHESKVPEGFEAGARKNEGIKILHFHFVLWERMLAKQAYIRTQEFLHQQRSSLFINFRYGITKEERGARFSQVPPAWIKDYESKTIDLENFSASAVYWYELEVLKIFQALGISKLRWLDIWDIPWEQKRQAALLEGYKVIPAYPIKDPRGFIVKLYHRLLYFFNIQKVVSAYAGVKSLWAKKTS